MQERGPRVSPRRDQNQFAEDASQEPESEGSHSSGRQTGTEGRDRGPSPAAAPDTRDGWRERESVRVFTKQTGLGPRC